jgi:hypothetical protein
MGDNLLRENKLSQFYIHLEFPKKPLSTRLFSIDFFYITPPK